MPPNKQYAERDHLALAEHYITHINALTAEGLHSKSAIAGELAFRDSVITALSKLVFDLQSERLTQKRNAEQEDCTHPGEESVEVPFELYLYAVAPPLAAIP